MYTCVCVCLAIIQIILAIFPIILAIIQIILAFIQIILPPYSLSFSLYKEYMYVCMYVYMYNDTCSTWGYGVATISGLLKIIVLFCNRAL